MSDAERSRSALAWSTRRQMVWLICRGQTFPTASRIALVVGTLLTAVNQGSALVSGDVNAATLLRVLANYLIPYTVSSIGYLASFHTPVGAPSGVPAQGDPR